MTSISPVSMVVGPGPVAGGTSAPWARVTGGAAVEDSGWTVGAYAALAGVGAVVAIAVGGWYTRRRWLR